MSEYEKVIQHLNRECEIIRGEWNGDNSGKLEDRATAAEELQELLSEVDEIVKELDL